MAKRPAPPCTDCIQLNRDPLAQVRANAALPSPLLRFDLSGPSSSSFRYGPPLKPARPTPSGRGG